MFIKIPVSLLKIVLLALFSNNFLTIVYIVNNVLACTSVGVYVLDSQLNLDVIAEIYDNKIRVVYPLLSITEFSLTSSVSTVIDIMSCFRQFLASITM